MGCVSAVKAALEGLQDVESAEVDLQANTARVEGDADAALVCQTLKDTGYPASLAEPRNRS